MDAHGVADGGDGEERVNGPIKGQLCKVFVVMRPDAVPNKATVVVHPQHAHVAHAAVVRAIRLDGLALFAIPQPAILAHFVEPNRILEAIAYCRVHRRRRILNVAVFLQSEPERLRRARRAAKRGLQERRVREQEKRRAENAQEHYRQRSVKPKMNSKRRRDK